jgi:hypothetical protein
LSIRAAQPKFDAYAELFCRFANRRSMTHASNNFTTLRRRETLMTFVS